jgi:hypothetical protein
VLQLVGQDKLNTWLAARAPIRDVKSRKLIC